MRPRKRDRCAPHAAGWSLGRTERVATFHLPQVLQKPS